MSKGKDKKDLKKRVVKTMVAAENSYVPFPVKVISKKIESPDTFTLRLDWQVMYEPGQFIQVSLPGIGEAPISISSYSDKYIEITIRKIGNVTNSLFNLKKGDKLFVRGPYGKGYPMESLKGNSIIFIGGGCGVAPLKGAIEYVLMHRKDFKDIILFIGYRSPDDILFTDRHNEWKQEFRLNMSVDTVPDKACYSGNVGFITNVVEKEKITNENKVVFMCGPPVMMQKSISILREKGFHDNQIFISAERLMYCAFGLCCHCMIHGKLTCMDGPVFRYDEVKEYKND
jgi:sulfite reductase subunit B